MPLEDAWALLRQLKVPGSEEYIARTDIDKTKCFLYLDMLQVSSCSGH